MTHHCDIHVQLCNGAINMTANMRLAHFYSYVRIFQDDVDPPKAHKILEQNFDPGPGFRAMVQNGPEMAQNGKSLTTPTVFKV